MNNKSKQVQDLRYLYESIYNQQPDTNLEELKLCAELYNIFLEKGLIEGNFISEEELYENVAKIASGIHKGINLIKGITGFGAKRTTQAGNIGKNLQKLATGGGVGVAADRTGLVDRTGAGLQGFAQEFGRDPKKKNQLQSFNVFDVIKGHLLDEGYADTEEAALKIMANMSEEWRQSILSEDPVQDYRDMKRSKENAAGMRGKELTHSAKPAGSASQKPGARSREFTNPPS